MNKTELAAAVSAAAGIPKTTAKAAVDATLEAIAEAVKSGDKVTLIGFGTFAVAERSARTGVNPATGVKIEIPAKKVVKFKPSSELAYGVE